MHRSRFTFSLTARLDRFARVVDQRWCTIAGGTDVERVKFGYDRDSDRLWRQNTVAGTLHDEHYAYDNLQQVTGLQRGTLNTGKTAISGTPTWAEQWAYDPAGNWHGSTAAYVTQAAGTTTLSQNRTQNLANGLTAFSTSVGTAWATPALDAAGNMTTTPQPFNLSTGFTLNYDAWNRLVAVNTGSVAAHAYDGANRRIAKTAGGVTRDYYYSDQWQVLEERLSTDPTAADRRFVWGMRGVDDLVRRDREVWVWVPAPPRPPHWHPGHGGPHGSSAAGSSSGSGWWSSSSGSSGGPVEVTERLYALDDPLNITAIIDGTTGAVLERHGFSGFGVPNYMNASFGSISGSAYDWETLFASYRYDTDTGLYQVRNRFYHPNLGRWPTRDPIGEAGGVNLYAYVGNNACNLLDPFGLASVADISSYLQAISSAKAAIAKSGTNSACCKMLAALDCFEKSILKEIGADKFQDALDKIDKLANDYQKANKNLKKGFDLATFLSSNGKLPVDTEKLKKAAGYLETQSKVGDVISKSASVGGDLSSGDGLQILLGLGSLVAPEGGMGDLLSYYHK